MVIAYEPIWAIGTGVTASSVEAQEVIGAIRREVAVLSGKEAACLGSIAIRRLSEGGQYCRDYGSTRHRRCSRRWREPRRR